MLQIKSAQYMRMPMPKALPEEQLDTRYEISQCQMCQDPKYADDLDEGFCQECLASGMIKQCNNCQKKITEDEGVETQDGAMCPDCAQDLYQTPRGGYSGPRHNYYSGPAELY